MRKIWAQLVKTCWIDVETRWVAVILGSAVVGLLLEGMIYVFSNTSVDREGWTPADNVVDFMGVWSPMLVLIPTLALVIVAFMSLSDNRRIRQQEAVLEVRSKINDWCERASGNVMKMPTTETTRNELSMALEYTFALALSLEELQDEAVGLPKKLDGQLEKTSNAMHDVASCRMTDEFDTISKGIKEAKLQIGKLRRTVRDLVR